VLVLDEHRLPPQAHGQQGGGQRDPAQREHGRLEPGLRTEPTGERVRQQPAAVREGELGGERGRTLLGRCRAADEPSGRGEHHRAGGAESGPHREEEGPAPTSTLRGRDGAERGEDDAEQYGARQHHRPVRNPVQHTRQGDRHDHRPGPVGAEREGHGTCRQPEEVTDVYDGVDGHHRARGGDREVEREQGAQLRDGEEEPGAGGGPGARAGVRRGVGFRQDHRDHQDGRGEEAEHGTGEQPVVGDQGEQRGRQRGGEQALQVVREP
jgi:hypothetical protein